MQVYIIEMTDNYKFMRSSESRNVDEYTPYKNKQYNFVNDTNSAVYTNTSLSLVQFDLSSIYNSQTFVDTNDMFLVIPLVTVAAFGTNTAGGTVAPVAGNYALTSIKSSYLNLIHQCDLNIDGKTIESTQPYQNVACNFRMMSEMSIGDQKTMGVTFGLSEVRATPNSGVFNTGIPAVGPTVTYRGNGFTNNVPFSNVVGGSGLASQSCIGPQNTGCVNESTQKRLGITVDLNARGLAAGARTNNVSAIIGTGSQSNN